MRPLPLDMKGERTYSLGMSAIKVSRARQTGTLIELWRAEDLGLEDEAGNWVTLCEHGSSCHHATRQTAQDWMASPATWCENGCQEAAAERGN